MALGKKKLNIKYGKKDNLPVEKNDGTLYVATKNNNKAQLYADLDSERYIIGDGVGEDVSERKYIIDNEEVIAGSYAEIFNDYNNNIATGEYSHAEGYETQATGFISHAEGVGTKATGMGAHAEGAYVKADGDNAHAEGNLTVASGSCSHAEGYETIAVGNYQHVQGKYNALGLDTNGKTFAHVVGNGESSTSRSNAHTLDWDGNSWFAGKVYVGGTSYQDAVSLAAIEVSSKEPTNENVDLWLNPENTSSIKIPEIKDEEVSINDTWSSYKINNKINNLATDYVIKVQTNRPDPVADKNVIWIKIV